eukprot:CAMPEP_0168201876 /NCGR_PEP_ID=MMETSP0139_2-20121125/23964_1 /TAXON_ID=44445 /ORGANISM="Pseudo-nitzschia australis, Strain 10249 10 AB" /LENGTH=67 /DNA_ID=CAMNT_0008127509 /DNA_START=149 /DNA_END=352 /DNA_ORIENTATION=-
MTIDHSLEKRVWFGAVVIGAGPTKMLQRRRRHRSFVCLSLFVSSVVQSSPGLFCPVLSFTSVINSVA